jgi:hypothetical protein
MLPWFSEGDTPLSRAVPPLDFACGLLAEIRASKLIRFDAERISGGCSGYVLFESADLPCCSAYISCCKTPQRFRRYS